VNSEQRASGERRRDGGTSLYRPAETAQCAHHILAGIPPDSGLNPRADRCCIGRSLGGRLRSSSWIYAVLFKYKLVFFFSPNNSVTAELSISYSSGKRNIPIFSLKYTKNTA